MWIDWHVHDQKYLQTRLSVLDIANAGHLMFSGVWVAARLEFWKYTYTRVLKSYH